MNRDSHKGNKFIIIGSGLGGLLSAAILSKEGFQVTVLEQNPVTGGCLQTFSRKGKVFDTGMHYIGSMEPGQVLHRIFEYIGLNNGLKIKRLDRNCFDKISFNGKEYPVAQGYENFIDVLSRYFPKRKDEIKNYIQGIREVVDSVELYNLRPFKQEEVFLNKHISYAASDFIGDITSDPVLQNVLAGLNGLYAGVKKGSPLYVHATINNFYLESAWRLVNGSSQIAQLLGDIIKKNGGKIITHAKVQSLVEDGERITMAVTDKGEEFPGNIFISSIHPSLTIKMLHGANLRKAYVSRIQRLENSMGMFIVYVILKKNSFPYMNYNYYYHDRDDVWTDQHQDSLSWPPGFMMYTSANDFEQKYAENLVVMSFMKYEQVKPWEDTKVGKRGESYEEFKMNRAERLLNMVEKVYPGIKSKIDAFYTSTPLTFRDYTGTKDGSSYGILKDSRNFMDSFLIPRTRIENLFLTGQNLNLHGILGVSLSAILTCSEFMGQEYLLKRITDAN